MSAELIRVVKIMITIPLAFFAVFGLFIECFVFSYLNQSIHTPETQRLTFYNYLLPLLLSMGFIFYFTREQMLSPDFKAKRKFNFIIASIIFIGASLAIPWQFKYLQWTINHKKTDFLLEWMPIITAMIFTIGAVIIQMINFIKKL